jgi:hypothetical protein
VTKFGQPLFIQNGRIEGGLAGLPGAAADPILARALARASGDQSEQDWAPPTRQRTKLWELNCNFHCSVIGTCLTAGELRRVMGKLAKSDISHFTDHELHAEAVGLCGRHNACSKLLQKALDQRHATVIKQFARLQGEAAVIEKWSEARRAGEIPGAYWAVLTHPDLGHAGARLAFGDVHMLSHLVGSANRADIRRLAQLEAENAALVAKVERQQLRLHEAITSRDATIRRLGSLAATQIKAADPDGDDELAALRDLVADLQARLATETSRRERLDQRVAEAAASSQRWERRAEAAEAESATLRRELAVLERRDDPASTRPETGLPAERVLYVGGHTGCVDQIRETLEAAGGELLSHDGGRHDHPSLLAGLISRADRVVFPVDCVSHDAALTVKRLCRQSGKRWLPLRSSGLASFLAALTEAADAPITT